MTCGFFYIYIYIYMYICMSLCFIPLPSLPTGKIIKKEKEKEKNFDVFIFANGPNLGRGGVEVYNNFVVWI
jgi:hypothetical protein